MNNDKKKRERRFLDEFIQLYPAFPIGKVKCHESPDFLIELETQMLGIEIIDFVRGQNEGESKDRRNEFLRDNIADLVKQKITEKYSIPLIITYHWKRDYLLRQSEVSEVSDEIVKLIELHIPFQVSDFMRIDFRELNKTELKDICSGIAIWRVKPNQDLRLYSGWIDVNAKEIQGILDLKNEKIHNYLCVCDSVWLIIVADGRKISSTVSISDEVANNLYVTSFERVFIYDRVNECVISLKHQ